ncbi:hypothetical protein EVAR_84785_1 [Eumeta japonica]|uniref:Uncharacterized protein n=1 Tax=Eumeta variegata TaxID=151549 RepID=A0A4C1U8V5_EUMVA|nr:hypothetical protein EVAR_84785_1 [Eumeta japonica]
MRRRSNESISQPTTWASAHRKRTLVPRPRPMTTGRRSAGPRYAIDANKRLRLYIAFAYVYNVDASIAQEYPMPNFKHPKTTSLQEKIDGCQRGKIDTQRSYHVEIYSLYLPFEEIGITFDSSSSSSSSSSLILQPVAMTERDKSRYTEGSVNIGGSVGIRIRFTDGKRSIAHAPAAIASLTLGPVPPGLAAGRYPPGPVILSPTQKAYMHNNNKSTVNRMYRITLLWLRVEVIPRALEPGQRPERRHPAPCGYTWTLLGRGERVQRAAGKRTEAEMLTGMRLRCQILVRR